MPLDDNSKPNRNKSASLARGMELRFAVLFLLIFCVLQYGYSASRGGMIEHLVIDTATVRPSTAIINLMAPDANAMASGHRIVSPLGSLTAAKGRKLNRPGFHEGCLV